MGKTIFDKIWESHIVKEIEGGPSILYIDRHFIHEVTSPQAFSGLEKRGARIFRPKQTFATCDHNVPTINQHLPIADESSAIPVKKLAENTRKHGITYFPLCDTSNGIVHIIGPELGITQVGMTIVCGDSHTSTHGAFGNIAFGIGTSEVEMVFATQSLLQTKPKQMLIEVNGQLSECVCAKDVILHIISKLGTSAGTGYFIEFAGSTIKSLSMEQRMTICNMSIEMGARGGLIAPDEITFEYLRGRNYAHKGKEWDMCVNRWTKLVSDQNAEYDLKISIEAAEIEPMITYGTNPGMGMAIGSNIPEISSFEDSLRYMGFSNGESLLGKKIDYVFLGSCTNGRIEDFRLFTDFVKGKRKAENVEVWLVPGSNMVKRAIEQEGLDIILKDSGFSLRQPGCSACLGMNEDKIPSKKYCISTSNRNFEGRQGQGARTLLSGPLVAAAAAVYGVITDPRSIK